MVSGVRNGLGPTDAYIWCSVLSKAEALVSQSTTSNRILGSPEHYLYCSLSVVASPSGVWRGFTRSLSTLYVIKTW